MARRKRLPKRKASPKKGRSEERNGKPLEISGAMQRALDGLAKPARAIFDRVDRFKREHPKLYDVITRDVDSPHYRKFERQLERTQARLRRGMKVVVAAMPLLSMFMAAQAIDA